MKKAEYIKEFTALWEDMVRTVYLKEPGNYAKDMAIEAWRGTKMSPLQYVLFIGNPAFITNMILRGQKAREIRWRKWTKKHGT